MSYYFRERPRFGERFRGKSGDELLEELKQEFGEDSPFFERTNGTSTPSNAGTRRDPFERHASFARGFPFDDDGGFGRRSDIRAHLDDLAARHPEFADHLLGPPWADVPFPGSGGSLPRNTRNRRGSGEKLNNRPSPATAPTHNNHRDTGSAYHHNHPDEDTRSQASGGSAASGASAVSSHGSEPDQHPQEEDRKSGLRNTLDIGQHQHNMENPQQQPSQQQRNVRSMSAPPENRNNNLNDPQRFVSRVDLTPQAQTNSTTTQPQPANNTQAQQQPQREKSPAPQGPKQHGNVRQIPIFVEGRDKPVIAKEHEFQTRDEPDFVPRRQQSPPHFQRPSHFQQHYNRQPPGWDSNFRDPFFEHSTGRWHPPPQQSTFPGFRHTQDKPKSQHQEFWHPNEPQPQQHKPHTQAQQPPPRKPQAQTEPQPEPAAPPKPKQQIQPKDPLEKVAMVQKEVDALTEQVKAFTGNSRQDKQYMYLDEMLTRELIKLDDIDTEGKENVRQARKQAIKSIQESISLLESKAPIPGQQPESVEKTEEKQEVKEDEMKVEGSEKPAEAMETSQEAAPEEQKAIPLPPPLSPSKAIEVPEAKVEENTSSNEITPLNNSNTQTQENVVTVPLPTTPVQSVQQETPSKVENNLLPNPPEQQQQQQQQQQPTPMEISNAETPQVPTDELKMEVKEPSPPKELAPNQEQPKEITQETKVEASTEEKPKPKKESPPVPAKPGKSLKKAKKTKKQPEPVSETPIPLPAPGQSI